MISDHSDEEYIGSWVLALMVGHHPGGAVVQTNATMSIETLSQPKCFKKRTVR